MLTLDSMPAAWMICRERRPLQATKALEAIRSIGAAAHSPQGALLSVSAAINLVTGTVTLT